MKYTIYQITNIINHKIYIGKHQTIKPNDGYYGSGKAIKEAIRKYGKENFIKEILFIFDTEEEMNAKERELINEEFVRRKDTYNLGIGGEGGPHFKGKAHSEETKRKIGSYGRKLTEETKRKISESNKKRVVSEETRKKLSIKRHLVNGKTFEEALELSENKKPKLKKSRSQAMKFFYEEPNNRLIKAEQMRKLHTEYNLDDIKKDYNSGMKPKDIMKKYNMTKNRYDHVRSYYLK